jgi:hypothetical protein
VMSWGWTNALKTSALGRRISIVALATSSARGDLLVAMGLEQCHGVG